MPRHHIVPAHHRSTACSSATSSTTSPPRGCTTSGRAGGYWPASPEGSAAVGTCCSGVRPPRRRRPRTRRLLVGRFLGWAGLPAHRMTATRRAVRGPAPPTGGLVASPSTLVAPTLLADDDSPLVLLAQLHLPRGTTRASRSTETGTAATYLQAPDGSWAEIAHASDWRSRHDTREVGPTRSKARSTRLRPCTTTSGARNGQTSASPLPRQGTHVWHHDPDTGPRWPLGTTWAANTGT